MHNEDIIRKKAQAIIDQPKKGHKRYKVVNKRKLIGVVASALAIVLVTSLGAAQYVAKMALNKVVDMFSRAYAVEMQDLERPSVVTSTQEDKEKATLIEEQDLYSSDTLNKLLDNIDDEYEKLEEIMNTKPTNSEEDRERRIEIKAKYENMDENFGNLDYTNVSEEQRLGVSVILYQLYGQIINSERIEKEQTLMTLDPNSDNYKQLTEDINNLKNKKATISEYGKAVISLQVEQEMNKGKGK